VRQDKLRIYPMQDFHSDHRNVDSVNHATLKKSCWRFSLHRLDIVSDYITVAARAVIK
jgi:hypothetical protein